MWIYFEFNLEFIEVKLKLLGNIEMAVFKIVLKGNQSLLILQVRDSNSTAVYFKFSEALLKFEEKNSTLKLLQ